VCLGGCVRGIEAAKTGDIASQFEDSRVVDVVEHEGLITET
jgi:hypothetical protein